MPSLQRLPVTTALGARYLISSSSSLLHLSYNLSCSTLLTLDRFSALFLCADKSSGRCSSLTHLSYNLLCSIPLTHACGQDQWTLALKVQFFLPELCYELRNLLLPAAFAAGGACNNSINTKSIHEQSIENISLYSLRYIAPIRCLDKFRLLYPQPRTRISALFVRPFGIRCSWLTLI